MNLVQTVKSSWRSLVVVLTPLLLSPLVFPYSETSMESKCSGLMILMAVYWITESVPLPVTALLPIALSPLLGLASSKQMCKAFFADISFLLIGGLIVAIAIEECGLHKRFALRTLMMIGVEPRRLLLGIMLTTAFLSMWISNTATTALMMPVTRALLIKLFNAGDLAKRRLASDGLRASKDGGHIPLGATAQSIRGSINNIDRRTRSSSRGSLHVEAMEPHILVPSTMALTVMHDIPATTPDHQSYRHQTDLPEITHHTSAHDLPRDKELHESGAKLIQVTPGTPDDEVDEDTLENLNPQRRAMLVAFSLCVCYSANIGGMATLTGTAPNLVISRIAEEISKSTLVTFANWFALSLPVSVLILMGSFLWMNITVFGFVNTLTCRPTATEEEVKVAKETIRNEYKSLGKIKFNEVVVLIHFLVLVLLWLARDPGSIPGWISLFPHKYISDSSVALAVSVSLFVFPNERPNILFFRAKGDSSPSRSVSSILNWKETCRKFPWGVIFLLGGGFALSEASKESGVSKLIANKLTFIRWLPSWTSSLVVTALTSVATEVMSNTVIVMLVLPILKNITVVMNVHPLYLMLPASLAASLAFMLPIATVPNALVFAYGDIRIIDMLKAGAALNVIGVTSVVLAINTWGYAIYNLGEFPSWATPVDSLQGAANYTVTAATTTNFTLVR